MRGTTTIPLICAARHPDGRHGVRSPGGYEWWYFDAEDAATDTQIVAILLEGFIFHPGYLRAIGRFRRRPTRTPPPLPGDALCAYLVVYQRGRIAHQFMTQYGAGDYSAADDAPEIRMGPNALRREADGSLRLSLRGTPWRLTARGPKTLEGQTLRGELTFRPLLSHPAHERPFLSRDLAGADHHWVIANPLCAVEADLHADGAAPIVFRGRGYHDHNYGAGPIGPGLRRWFWGRVLLEDRVATFHYAVPRGAGAAETHLILADASRCEERRVRSAIVPFDRLTPLLLRYPGSAEFDEVLRLGNPRVIDLAPFYMRLMYDAVLEGRAATAFCEIAYPHRLRWPVLGRMIEMSIDKRPMRAGGGR